MRLGLNVARVVGQQQVVVTPVNQGIEDALETNTEIIATGCPFCNTMMTDVVKVKES